MSAMHPHARAVLRRAVPLALFVLALATCAHATTWSHDAAVNLQLVKLPGEQCVDDMVSDGGHGAIVFWVDPCGDPLAASPPNASLHSLRVLGNGEFDPAWNSAALPGTDNLFDFLVLPDGAGGAFVGWADERNRTTTGRDVYLQHVRAGGTADPAWPLGGRAVCTATGTQITPDIASDGAGGVILVWTDRRDSLTTSGDIYAAHVLAGGTLDPAWPANGLAVCKTNGLQQGPRLIPDGAGGALVSWSDLRNGPTGSDVYMGHVRANGTVDPAWPATGRALFVATGSQATWGFVTDGAGGAFLSWHDSIRPSALQHVRANGTLDPAWPASGAALDPTATSLDDIQLAADGGTGVYVLWDAVTGAVANNDLYARHLLADGTSDPAWPADPVRLEPGPSNKQLFSSYRPLTMPDGSVLFDWQDDRYGTSVGVFAGRLLPNGTVDATWPTGGRLLTTNGGDYPSVVKVSDGRGGALYAWTDVRDTAATSFDVYADRLGTDGLRGVDQPEWHAVRDVAGDQGGHVSLQWYWSSWDNMPADPLAQYVVWRRLDAAMVTPEMQRHAWPASSTRAPQPGELRVRGSGVDATFWEYIASVPPRGLPNYALTVNTLADSSGAGAASETFEIDAMVASTAYSSDPDSGYSVDNLAPGAPSGFAGTFARSGTSLVWDPLIVADLAGYRLYRGSTPGFVPSAANRIGSPTTTHFTDAGTAPAYYKLTGLDVHGNEGPAATVLPAGTTGVGDDAPVTALAFALGSASPALRGATFALALPHASRATLALYDAAGRRVRTLLDGPLPAGRQAIAWDLRDADGSEVRDGLYFATLDANGERRSTRVIVLR